MAEARAGRPQKVLYVENGIGYGGAVICLRHLVRNLDRTRFEPLVVTGRGGPLYQDIANDAPWKHIADRHIDTVAMQARLDKAQWVRGVPGLFFICNQLIARLDDLGNFLPFFLQLLWTAIRFRPAIIHANNEPLCNRAGVLVAMLLRIPIICHVRGDQKGSRMMTWFYHQITHFIPVSHWVSDSVGRLGIPAERRTVVYDGIELDQLNVNADGAAFRRRHGIAADAFAVGLVGLLIPWKGQRLFLQAAKILADKIPKLRMPIVGGTPEDCVTYEMELKREVKESGLSDVVVFTGHATDMAAVYNGLDVVVSASIRPEPLGTVVIETLAMGRALVAPNHGGAAEMSRHEATALLFEAGNAHDLATDILRLYREPDLGARLGAAARAHALTTFDVHTHAAKVQEIYRRVTTHDIPAGS